MHKVISFSLWGNNPKYTVGAIENAKLALSIYPEWECKFYIGHSVPMNIVSQLVDLPNTVSERKEGDG